MTFEEKKNLLNAHKTEKMYWQIMVALQALALLNGLYAIIGYFSKHAVAGLFGSALIFFILIVFAINAWIGWGVYKLERWVTLWMWIAVIGSAISFNIVNLAVSILVLLGYKKVLKVVYPSASSAPTPPQTPAQ